MMLRHSFRPKRGHVAFRFLLVIAATLFVPTVVYVQWQLRENKEQQQLAESIHELGGKVEWSSADVESVEITKEEEQTSLTFLNLDHLEFPSKIVAADLSHTSTTDEQIAQLTGLESLRTLDLRNTPITDAVVPHLVTLPQIDFVDLRGTEITDVGIDRLQARHPTAQILHDILRPVVPDNFPRPTVAYQHRMEHRRSLSKTTGSGLGRKFSFARNNSTESPNLTEQRPEASTIDAVELGLSFLAREQQADGHWSLESTENTNANQSVSLSSDVAATGLSLLALLGAGYDHTNSRHGEVVSHGLNYLIEGQAENGDLFVPIDPASASSMWLYSHGIATIALCEAYGMTKAPHLEKPSQRAIDFIVASQHPERGGWRYSPNISSDTSVTGWMAMALHSARSAGLTVPQESFDGIGKWLDYAQATSEEPHLYRYNPDAPDTVKQRHGRLANPTMTSVGLLMRMYMGWESSDPRIIQGAEYLAQFPPANELNSSPVRDSYYWYYATQALFHVGRESWDQWNRQIHPLLIESQIHEGEFAGSWDPLHPVPDRWAKHAGRLYVTTLNLLTLEIYFRHLPIYDVAVSNSK